LLTDLLLIYPFAAVAQFKGAFIANCPGSFDLGIKKIEMEKVLVRAFVILISVWSLLSGCADTQQVSQDSDSMLRKSDGDHEVHGEVGAMYGHTAR
jgi:hypothetical protein